MDASNKHLDEFPHLVLFRFCSFVFLLIYRARSLLILADMDDGVAIIRR